MTFKAGLKNVSNGTVGLVMSFVICLHGLHIR